MTYVLHGIAGNENHSTIIGAVDASSPNEVRQALRKFHQTYPESVGKINRARFNQFVLHSGLKVVPVVGLDLDHFVP